jgi:hypothetical protein
MERFASFVPNELFNRSGSVFYSGRAAFSRPSPIYIVGMNPGGDAGRQRANTIGKHLAASLERESSEWSEYVDESWEGASPGTWGMQPRIQHFCGSLGFDARLVPASNLVFVRSNREGGIDAEKRNLINLCWPFHNAILEVLQPKIVVCLGKTVGKEIRDRIGANTEIDIFVEKNDRRWKSTLHSAASGVLVAAMTHPSIAAWNVSETDPTPMIAAHL